MDNYLIFILLSNLALHSYWPNKHPSKFWAGAYAALALVYFAKFIAKILA